MSTICLREKSDITFSQSLFQFKHVMVKPGRPRKRQENRFITDLMGRKQQDAWLSLLPLRFLKHDETTIYL